MRPTSSWLPRLLRHRLVVAGVCAATLLALGQGFAQRVQEREAWLADCQRGADCGQRRVFLALVDVIERDEHGVVVLKQARRLRLYGTPGDLRPGDTISVIARFDGQGRLQVQELERHPWRPLKKGLGVLGLLLGAGLCVWGLRWERGGLVEHG